MDEVFAGREMADDRLAAIAERFGLSSAALAAARRLAVDRPAAALTAALDAAAFGAASILVEVGAAFFGNDPLASLEHHLAAAATGRKVSSQAAQPARRGLTG